jgi:hypothetical protein
VPDGVICPRCSVLNIPGARFCTACGTELPESEDPTGTYPQVGIDVPEEGEVGQLIVTRGATAGARYALESGETTIGRHPESDIFLDDVTVSRRHARIVVEGSGQHVLEDAGSLNGTYVDGERVDRAPLREGAQIQVGKFRLVFVIGTLGGHA